MEDSGRHARTRAITRDTLSPANRTVAGCAVASRDVARVVSDVSVLCPGAVDPLGNKANPRVIEVDGDFMRGTAGVVRAAADDPLLLHRAGVVKGVRSQERR
jgi:hypothetical protein